MRFMETDVVGASLIDPTPHEDDRGRFMRAWCSKDLRSRESTLYRYRRIGNELINLLLVEHKRWR